MVGGPLEWATGWVSVGASVSSVEGWALECDGGVRPGRAPLTLGVGLGTARPTAIPMEGTEDTDSVIRTTATGWGIPMVDRRGKNERWVKMPFGDGTGPRGLGPMTGRRAVFVPAFPF